MTRTPSGHIEQLPSGAWRAKVYAGKDPLTGREIRFRKTRKTEVEAQIELGRLLALARAGRNPDSGVTVAELLDQYVPVAGWDLSTEESSLGYIRRTIKPALGVKEIRKVRGPLLDNLYARLKKCGDLACTGRLFTEHRHVPDLRPDPSDPRMKWQQTAGKVREAITCGALVPGDDLPSVSELARLQGLKPGTIQHAFLVLAEEGLLVIRHGRTAQIAGDAPADSNPAARYRSARSRPGHDCALSGCRPHVCHPMKPSTIHGIHSILSGAFEAALRWEWVDFNPAESAKPPSVTKKKTPAIPPDAVVKLIAQARRTGQGAVALYVWLAAITGVRRGELCGVQIRDIDLDNGVLHVAFNYVVKGGKQIRKDTKTHQDRSLALDPVTCTLIREHLASVVAALADTGVKLVPTAYLFSNQPANARPWNPDWASHRVADLAAAAGVQLNIKALRHYTASQLLAAGFDLGNTAARLGHSGGGATTLKHYADPISEVDRRAAAYLAQLTIPPISEQSIPARPREPLGLLMCPEWGSSIGVNSQPANTDLFIWRAIDDRRPRSFVMGVGPRWGAVMRCAQ
jgi:integrase